MHEAEEESAHTPEMKMSSDQPVSRELAAVVNTYTSPPTLAAGPKVMPLGEPTKAIPLALRATAVPNAIPLCCGVTIRIRIGLWIIDNR